MRLTRTLADEALRCLQRGWSHRRTAREVGISRSSVCNIAQGYRPREDAEDDLLLSSGPPERCHGCGGTVYKPCVLCRTREFMAQDAARAKAV